MRGVGLARFANVSWKDAAAEKTLRAAIASDHIETAAERPVNRNGEQFAFVSKMTNCVFLSGKIIQAHRGQ